VRLDLQEAKTSLSTPGRTPTCREGGLDGSLSCPSPRSIGIAVARTM
jgi:hypothetical protein